MSVSMLSRGAAVARLSAAPRTGTDGGYPWHDGELLYADDLNAAITAFGANVLDFGAKGDGITDDTAAIQLALDTYAGKAIVFIPVTPQPYMVRTLRPPSDTNLVIAGTLMQQPNMVAGGIQTVGVIAIEDVNNVSISGTGTLDGNWLNQTFNGLSCISALRCNNVRIAGLTMQHSYTWSFNVVTCSNVVVSGCTMLDCRAEPEFAGACNECWLINSVMDGVSVDGGFAFYGGVTNSGIIGCTLTNSNGDGMSIVADPAQNALCKGILIANNVIYGNKDTGIYITSSGVNQIHEDIVITGNVLYNNNTANGANGNSFPASDIWVSSCRGVVVSGNKCGMSGAGSFNTYGISIGGWGGYQASWCVSVTGNEIRNPGQGSTTGVGIFLAPVQGNDIMISGNHIYDDQTTHTMLHCVAGGCGGTTSIIGNHFGNCGGAPISLATATDTVVANAWPGLYRFGTATTVQMTRPLEYANSNGDARWFVGNDLAAESTGNAGSNFEIVSLTDDGSTLKSVMTINRATSLVQFPLAGIVVAGISTLNGGIQFGTFPVQAINDAAAAAAGVPLFGVYRNGSTMMVRVS